jgi:hypothetical protein
MARSSDLPLCSALLLLPSDAVSQSLGTGSPDGDVQSEPASLRRHCSFWVLHGAAPSSSPLADERLVLDPDSNRRPHPVGRLAGEHEFPSRADGDSRWDWPRWAGPPRTGRHICGRLVPARESAFGNADEALPCQAASLGAARSECGRSPCSCRDRICKLAGSHGMRKVREHLGVTGRRLSGGTGTPIPRSNLSPNDAASPCARSPGDTRSPARLPRTQDATVS